MKSILLFFLVLSLQISAQCVPGKFTYTINGLYSSDLNLTNGDTVLIATTATVTGNINLINSRIVNCGNILNSKIHLKGNWLGFNGKLENYGDIKTDSILVDTIGDIHNRGIIDVNYTNIGLDGNIDNYVIYRTNDLEMNRSWFYYNNGHLFVYNKMNLTDTRVRNDFMIHCKNEFLIDSLSLIYNGCTIYTDSLFTNKGIIMGITIAGGKVPKLFIQEKSENYGLVKDIDVCDVTTITSGGFDISTGTLTNVTFCQAAVSCPDYTMIGINEEISETENIALYPNPANTEFSISGLNDIGNHSLRIRNLLGQELFFTEETQKIDVNQLNSGIYFAEVYEKGKFLKSLKFIKN